MSDWKSEAAHDFAIAVNRINDYIKRLRRSLFIFGGLILIVIIPPVVVFYAADYLVQTSWFIGVLFSIVVIGVAGHIPNRPDLYSAKPGSPAHYFPWVVMSTLLASLGFATLSYIEQIRGVATFLDVPPEVSQLLGELKLTRVVIAQCAFRYLVTLLNMIPGLEIVDSLKLKPFLFHVPSWKAGILIVGFKAYVFLILFTAVKRWWKSRRELAEES